jgi:mono/diheme cytochrome c family protein
MNSGTLTKWPRTWTLLFLLTSASARADNPGAIARSEDALTGGAAIYQRICQGCHMPDGEGAIGAGSYPKLASNVALASWQYVALTVIRGRSAMPAFGAPAKQVIAPRTALLTDAQIAAVVNYLRTHFGNSYPGQVTPAQVRSLPHPDAVAHP